MKKAYITNGNYKNLIRSFKIYNVDYVLHEKYLNLPKDVLSLFSDYEIKKMTVYKNIALNPNEFLKNNKITNDFIPSKLYMLYEDTKPAYHYDKDCECSKNSYENYKIDSKIEKSKLEEYKNWVKDKMLFLETNLRAFTIMHEKEWGTEISLPEYIEKENLDIYDIKSIRKNIKNYIEQINKIINSIAVTERDTFKKHIKFSYGVKKGYANKEIFTKYNEKYYIINRIKEKMISTLLDLYICEHGKNISFDASILNQKNFKPCSKCFKKI